MLLRIEKFKTLINILLNYVLIINITYGSKIKGY